MQRDHDATKAFITILNGTSLPADAIPAEAPVVMVKAGICSGKTKVLVDTIHADNNRTLLGSHRRNLPKKTSDRSGSIPYQQDGEIFNASTSEGIKSCITTSGGSPSPSSSLALAARWITSPWNCQEASGQDANDRRTTAPLKTGLTPL